MRKIFTLIFLLALTVSASAQRQTDKLDRGLVAVPSGNGAFVSWRIFGEEYYDTQYNLYRDGQLLNEKPLKVSNYIDNGGKAGSKYQVAAVVRGVEQAKSAETTRLNQQYMQFAVKDLYSRRGTKITDDYQINDIALADVNGDGIAEFIMKRNYKDKMTIANDTAFNCIECYTLKGERLWWIDLGPNMVSGPDEQYDAVGYDWDGDGRAEILMRGADNMIIHHPDGTTTNIGNMSVNTRNTVRQDDGNGAYTNTGAEYLLYLEGSTGKPYSIGSGSTPLWMTYPLPRGDANDWGDGYGHRSTKHYFGAPCLDGRNAYIFLGRGCYTKHHMKAFSVDPQTHKLKLYWEWQNNNGWSDPWYGNGYHNFGIADVDWDGRDEICFGSMVIDDNGKGLSTTGLGHGDAQHCGDFDPYRHGQEIFACNEDEPAMNYRDATTSKIYYRLQSTSDDGRALCGNFSNDYPGAIGHSSQSGTVSCVSDKVISGGPTGFTNNFRIYWDGDLLEEGLDGRGTEGICAVYKADGSMVFSTSDTKNCNWTKNTPSATGDVLGDWREEIIVRTSDNRYVRVYTTNIYTQWRNYTLWHDHQYRQGMVWESVGYNQPPHASYFIGELEGITVAPPPFTMTGRTEVKNGGTIDASLDDQHVLVCETLNSEVTVAEGAKPYMVTFNVPSWVQGTNSSKTDGTATIRRTLYNCTVQGAAFTGSMRLVKQGDGVLWLPATNNTYTGETNIWAGTVNFDGQLKNSTVWLNRFAQLNSNGGQFRSIKMDYDAKLHPGRETHVGTITTDSLLLGFGARLVIDISDDLTADRVNTKYLSIETKNWQYGPQYTTPVLQVVHLGEGELCAVGSYLIGEIGSIKGSIDNIRIEGIGTSQKANLSLNDGKLYLVISNMRSATSIAWTGAESAEWDLDHTANFATNDGQAVNFVTGDNVWFGDEATQQKVSINSSLEADTIFVDSEKDYTFQGTGAIIGQTTLVKQGKGSLTINTENTYTGGNRISGGAVIVSSLANANQAKGNLGGVTTVASKFVMENGGELRTTATVTNGSAIRFDGEQGGVINNQADFVSDRAMSGTTLTKKGNGWLKLNTPNSSLNRMVIAQGTVQCINANVPAKTVEYQGGTLRENTGTSYAIDVPKGKSGTWYMANRSTYTNKLTGEGTITIYCTTEKGSNYYATRTPVQCNFADFEGTIKPTSSQDDPSVLRFTLNTSSGMPRGTMDIAANVQVQNSGKTFRIGRLAGTGSLGGSCTFSNGASVGANTWEAGNDDSWSWSGTVASNANFVKVGSGKMTVRGAWTNTGTVRVREGELSIGSGGQLSTGSVTVDEGGMLSGTTTAAKPLNNASFTINGVLRPGLTETTGTGTLYLNEKNVTIGTGGTLQVTARSCATNSSAGCSSIAGVKTLTVNGTIRVLTDANNTLEAGDSIRLWKATTFVGEPKFEFVGALLWDTSRISEGLLFVKGIDTGISTAISQEAPANIYDLRGRVVRTGATTTEGLPAGIYIIRGKKVVIDGSKQ